MTDTLGQLQSEVRGTQHVLVALLQERLETETNLKAARAELEHVTRSIEQARSEQTRQVVEFDRVVQGAIAEGRTRAAEIEELVRRRDAAIEHQPEAALNATPTTLPVEPSLSARPESAATMAPALQHEVSQPTIALPSATSTVPTALPAIPAQRAVPQPAPRFVTPLVSGVSQHAPRLAMPTLSVAEPAKLLARLRSIREQVTARAEQLQAHRYTAALGRVRLHRPGLRQMANIFIGCILAVLAILLTPVSQVIGGLQLMAVMSGSMEPTIPVGGIVGVRPVAATDLQVGNVITFATQANPDVLVTHRIVNLETRDGQTMVTTKGDANDSVDAMAAPADHAVGRVDFSLPWLGYLMVWLASPVAKVLILVVTVISFALPSVKRSPEPAAARPHGDVGELPATSYTALEDEIQALLTTPTHP
jgi:signal peptidase I